LNHTTFPLRLIAPTIGVLPEPMPTIGTSLTIIAYHERLGERTIQNRIDQSLDTMRQQFTYSLLPKHG
jgi:hypothetical protein